jgi:hypothetical protein
MMVSCATRRAISHPAAGKLKLEGFNPFSTA